MLGLPDNDSGGVRGAGEETPGDINSSSSGPALERGGVPTSVIVRRFICISCLVAERIVRSIWPGTMDMIQTLFDIIVSLV